MRAILKRHRNLLAVAVVAVSVGVLAFTGPIVVAKGKPGGGGGGGGGGGEAVPPGTIYFARTDGSCWRMNGDGSGQTETVCGVPSYGLHGGSRWFLQTIQVGVDGTGRPIHDLFAVDETGESFQLTFLEDDPNVASKPSMLESWAKDDSLITFSTWFRDTPDDLVGRLGLFVVAIDWSGGVPSASPHVLLIDNAGSADWAPTGDAIAYTGLDQNGNSTGLYVAAFGDAGTETWQIAPAGSLIPAWSPDGSRIAFDLDYEIWTVHPDGSNPVQLTAATFSKSLSSRTQHNPHWSPDGAYIAYTEQSSSYKRGTSVTTWDVLRIAAAGGTPVKLTADGDSFIRQWVP